jgi:hypothetical protein
MSFANRLLAKFPKIVPSYERILNKKEHTASLFSIIPKGLKSYLWFTYVEDKNVCCLLSLDNKKRIHSIEYQPMCFSSTLSMGQYGTILYGTSFYSSCENGHKIKCFSCEDIIYYIGNKMEWNAKTSFLSSNELVDLFTRQIKQVVYNKNFMICGLPIITRQLSDAYEFAKNLPYTTYGIQQRTPSGQVIGITPSGQVIGITPSSQVIGITPSSQVIGITPSSQVIGITTTVGTFSERVSTAVTAPPIHIVNNNTVDKRDIIFKVNPSIHPDIYELHCQDDDAETECYYGVAMIPSYKSSVFMNGLFRKIKENGNLDLLEESDDEEEFQDNRNDKFVNLEKFLYMKCVFNKKFNKWQPIMVVNEIEEDRLITKKEVLMFERNSRLLS